MIARRGITSAAAVWAIESYRRYLSPRKGFACPHRLVHGGRSCSAYAKAAVRRRGVVTGLRLLSRRFSRCAAAARELRESPRASGGGSSGLSKAGGESAGKPATSRPPGGPNDDKKGRPHERGYAYRFGDACVDECCGRRPRVSNSTLFELATDVACCCDWW